jgi:hypothetical protein
MAYQIAIGFCGYSALTSNDQTACLFIGKRRTTVSKQGAKLNYD